MAVCVRVCVRSCGQLTSFRTTPYISPQLGRGREVRPEHQTRGRAAKEVREQIHAVTKQHQAKKSIYFLFGPTNVCSGGRSQRKHERDSKLNMMLRKCYLVEGSADIGQDNLNLHYLSTMTNPIDSELLAYAHPDGCTLLALKWAGPSGTQVGEALCGRDS